MGYGFSIDPVPPEGRKYGLTENFAIWFGAGISIAEFWAGASLVAVPISLSLKSSLVAILLGHAIGNALLAAVGYVGVKTGLPTMVISRMSLGLKGSYLVSALNYLQLIGWTAVMLVVGALAMNNLSLSYGLGNLYFLWVAVLGASVTAWSLIGPEKWGSVEKGAAALLLALTIWLGYVLFTQYGVAPLMNSDFELSQSFWVGLDLVIAMPVSWAPLVADYTRFSKKPSHGFWGSYFGYFLSSGLFYFFGAFSNSVIHKLDPIAVIAYYGLGVPAMTVIVFSTLTTTFLDVYSAAMTYKNIRPSSNAKLQVILAGVLGTALATVFPTTGYEWFLILVGGAFVSLTAVMVADYLIRGATYSPQRVLRPERPFRWGALGIWGFGFIFYILLAISGLLPGIHVPFFSDLGAAAGSSIPTLAAVFILYLIYTFIRR